MIQTTVLSLEIVLGCIFAAVAVYGVFTVVMKIIDVIVFDIFKKKEKKDEEE